MRKGGFESYEKLYIWIINLKSHLFICFAVDLRALLYEFREIFPHMQVFA